MAAVGSVESFTLDLKPTGSSKPGAFDNVGSIAAGSSTITSVGVEAVEETFHAMKDKFDEELFLYETPLMEWVPSNVYRFDDFMDGLNVMHSQGIAGKKVCRDSMMGDDSSMLRCYSARITKRKHAYHMSNICSSAVHGRRLRTLPYVRPDQRRCLPCTGYEGDE